MIAEDAAQLGMLAAEVKALRRSQQHSQSLAHRRKLVDALLNRAQAAAASSAAISARLGEPGSPSPLYSTAQARAIEWSSALNEDLGQALDGDTFTGFQNAVDKAIRELERQAASDWQRYAARRAPETSSEVLAALAADPQAGKAVARIGRLSDTISRLRERHVPTPEELDQFDAAAAEIRSAWSTLDVMSLSDEVAAFLRAANSDRGAPLGLLTTSVLDWLQQRNAVDRYTILPSDQ
jgi:hypothetical protein